MSTLASLLAAKLLRELRADWLRTLGLIGITALGSMLFVSSYAGYLDLGGSYRETRDRLRLADWTLPAAGVSEEDAAAVQALPSVRFAEARSIAQVPAVIRSGRSAGGSEEDVALSLRVLAPPRNVNLLHLVSGAEAGPGEVLVEKHLADYHHLAPGSTITLGGGADARELRVAGLAVSAEYLWVARSRQDLFPTPAEFGVVWAPEVPLGPTTELLVEAESDPEEALAATRELLAGRSVVVGAPQPEDEVLGIELLSMDLDGFRQMAYFFPLFFFLVGAFIQASLLHRTVQAQRPLIGTLSALGVGRRDLLLHYLGFGLVVGGAGGVLGAILGQGGASEVTASYASRLGVPFVRSAVRPGILAIGVLAPLLVALLATLGPARRASSRSPVESMRGPSPVLGLLTGGRRLGRTLPLTARLALRNLLRNPGRALATAAGVSAALVLVLVGSQVLASMRRAIDVQFEDAQRYALRADLAIPMPAPLVRARCAELAGEIELGTTLPVTLRTPDGGRSEQTLLQGIPTGASQLRAVNWHGDDLSPAPGELVLSSSLARSLGVSVGDELLLDLSLPLVSLTPLSLTRRVSALADGALGSAASMELGDLQAALGLPDRVNTVLSRGGGEDARETLSALPGLVRLQDLAAFRGQIKQLTALSWAALGTMLAFSVLLAAAILFNTATLSVLERRRELATMRALGMPMRTLSVALSLENASLAALGVAAGVPVSALVIRRALAMWSSDLFDLPFVFAPESIVVAGLGVLAVLLLAQWLPLRGLARANLAEATRSRE